MDDKRDKVYDSGDRYPTELIKFNYIVTKQIDLCRERLSSARTKEQILDAKQSVDVFENMIIPCLHPKNDTEKKIKELTKKYNAETEKLQRKDRILTEPQRILRYAMQKWRLLMHASTDEGFTVINKETVDIA